MVSTREDIHKQLDEILNQVDDEPLKKLARYIAEELQHKTAWMSVTQAATHFGVGETTIREAVAANTIPNTKIQGRVIILVNEVRNQALQSVK